MSDQESHRSSVRANQRKRAEGVRPDWDELSDDAVDQQDFVSESTDRGLASVLWEVLRPLWPAFAGIALLIFYEGFWQKAPIEQQLRQSTIVLHGVQGRKLGDRVHFEQTVSAVAGLNIPQKLDMEVLDPEELVSVLSRRQLEQWQDAEEPYLYSDVVGWKQTMSHYTQYAYIRSWDDGSILLLDLTSNTLVGYLTRAAIEDLED